MAEPGLPAITEQIITDIVEGLANDIEFITEALMPDGKMFGQEAISDDEALDKYLASGMHDNPQACAEWIRNGVQMITAKLAQFGVPPPLYAAVHPYDIVQAAGYKLSAKMEGLLREREARMALNPPLPFDQAE